MRKIFGFTTLLYFMFFASFSSIALSQLQNSPCASYLCLAGGVQGAVGIMECSAAIERYSSIRVKDDCQFNPEKTAKKREAYLRTCPGVDESFIKAIDRSYGKQWKVDIFLRKG